MDIKRLLIKKIVWLALVSIALMLAGCATHQQKPRQVHNVCQIFKQNPKWYHATKSTAKRWGVPVHVQMAIIHQESGFDAHAQPPRRRLFWIIPWTRPSTAYGYSQALNGTWDHYKKSSRRYGAKRHDFSHAADFMGWYVNNVHRKLGISKEDAYNLYLAYHDGIGGYSRRTHYRKAWLINVAKKVKVRAWTYQKQLERCEAHLPKLSWYHLK